MSLNEIDLPLKKNLEIHESQNRTHSHCGRTVVVCTHISNAVAMKKISIGTRQSRGDLDTAAELLSRAQEIYTSR